MNHKPTPTRPAREGETCVCGDPATVVWLLDDFGPVPFCGNPRDGHKVTECPPWCVDDHIAPFDRAHGGVIHGVELDAHSYQVRTTPSGGKWETYRHTVLAGISQDRPDADAYIALIGQNEKSFSHLTAYEADQLADILRDLAVTLYDAEAKE